MKNKYIKIIEIFPINFSFKSESEKAIILESYKNFLKNLNIDIQIFIYSQKECLYNYFNSIKTKTPKKNEIKEEYENYLKCLITKNRIYRKRFFIIVSQLDEIFSVKELDNKIKSLTNLISNINDFKIINNRNDIFEILSFIYK